MTVSEPKPVTDQADGSNWILSAANESRRDGALRQAAPVVWWTTLLAPLVVCVVGLALAWAARGWHLVIGIAGTALVSTFFGKFIILGGTNGSTVLLTAEELCVLVVLMDVMVGCWFVYHLGFVLRIPFFGPRFALMVEDGEYWLSSHPWLRRSAFIGLVLFVMIPFAMTGSVGGSILARLLGMTRNATLLAIFLGSMLGSGLMYFVGSRFPALFDPSNPFWTVGGILIISAIIVLLNFQYARAKARLRERQAKSAP